MNLRNLRNLCWLDGSKDFRIVEQVQGIRVVGHVKVWQLVAMVTGNNLLQSTDQTAFASCCKYLQMGKCSKSHTIQSFITLFMFFIFRLATTLLVAGTTRCKGRLNFQDHASGLTLTPSRLSLHPPARTYNSEAAHRQWALRLIEYSPVTPHTRVVLVSFPADLEQGKKNAHIRTAKVATWNDKSHNSITVVSLRIKIIHLGK